MIDEVNGFLLLGYQDHIVYMNLIPFGLQDHSLIPAGSLSAEGTMADISLPSEAIVSFDL